MPSTFRLRQAIVTKTANQVSGTRHHVIQFEPWAGGPSSTISENVPRKSLALHPSAVSPGSGSAGTAPVVVRDPPARGGGRKSKTLETATAAAPQDLYQQAGEEKEEGAGGVRGEALSPPAGSMVVYPVGTTVVVRSIKTDPGRTLKFARCETNMVVFEKVLGREVSPVRDTIGRR